MRNREVAEMLDRTARILSLRGENRYRVRAYKRAARAIAAETRDIEELLKQNKLQTMPGVGPGLAARIKEILHTGKAPLLERLESGKIPPAEGRIILLASALTLATDLLPELSSLPGVTRAVVTGCVRRACETVERLDLVLAADDLGRAREAVREFPRFSNISFQGNQCLAYHNYGLPLSLYLVGEDEFVLTVWLSTGTDNHVREVADIIKERSGTDILHQGEKRLSFTGEDEIYALAGLPFIDPELREGRGEVIAAAEGRLPRLVDTADYQGDLHVHTDWSDGAAALEKMVEAAANLGYSYLAITDHSRSLKVAGGLSLERLAAQVRAIRDLQKKYPGIRVLCGIEADILDDGSLDAPDDILAGLDVVIASVHSGFRQSREKLTGRICRAMQNPYVHVVGHATGRLLGKRNAYDVDIDAIIRTARQTGTALEINSSPDRLDINDVSAAKARAAGVLVAVNTDAHSQLELANVSLGLAVARRAWLSAKDVINTRSTEEVLEFLRKNRVNKTGTS